MGENNFDMLHLTRIVYENYGVHGDILITCFFGLSHVMDAINKTNLFSGLALIQ